MPQVFGPSGANKGLGAYGVAVSFSLNPMEMVFYAYGIQDALAEVKVFVIDDGTVTFVPEETVVHRNDIDSYHVDEVGKVSPQHTPSGLDPAANPPTIWRPDTGFDDDD